MQCQISSIPKFFEEQNQNKTPQQWQVLKLSNMDLLQHLTPAWQEARIIPLRHKQAKGHLQEEIAELSELSPDDVPESSKFDT